MKNPVPPGSQPDGRDRRTTCAAVRTDSRALDESRTRVRIRILPLIACAIGLTALATARTALGGLPLTAAVVAFATALLLAAGAWIAWHLQREVADVRREAVALEHANGELQAFVRTVSHDLKAPLVSTTGFLRMARDGIDDGDRESAVEWLDRTAASTSRMGRMISELLERSMSPDPPERVPVDLDVVTERAIDETGADVCVAPDLGLVMGDPGLARQAIRNLVDNAHKYGGSRGVEIHSERDGDAVLLAVVDHGSGVDPADRERILQEGTRLDTHRGTPIDGSGVGLSLVLQVMRSMGGDVQVRETPGGGATFRLRFQACATERATA